MTDRSRFSRWSTLSWRFAVLIIGLLAASALVTTAFVASTERSNERRRNNESMKNVHESVARTLEQADSGIQKFREDALAARKQKLKDLTDAQLAALESLNDSVQAGSLTLEAAQTTASAMLFNFRYGNDDYFFAFTPDMVSIVEPNPTFRGNMLDYRDPSGKAFFREFQSVALGPGSGFVDYVGTRMGAAEPAPKVSYVAYFAPWKWVVGTGVYLDDIDAVAAEQLAAVKLQLSESLERVRFVETGFFFVLDRDGTLVAGPQTRRVDELNGSVDDSLVQQLVAKAPPDGALVSMDAEARLGGAARDWRFDISSVGSKRWVLVAAVPRSALVESANDLAARQILLSAIVLALGLIVGLLVSRRIVRPVQDITRAALALEEERFDHALLDRAANRGDEVGVLARAFRRMAAEVVERERSLRERVRRLEVVIDQRKVDHEINTIVETDFFRRLEARAENLRRTDNTSGSGESDTSG